MRVLFLFQVFSFERSTIYLDLINEMNQRGHKVTVIAGTTDKSLPDGPFDRDGIEVIYLKLADQFGAGKIKKGLIQLSIGPLMSDLIKTCLWERKFDVIAYPTPPITLAGVVKKCREHFKCITYLMLKDIFPQNAVDIGMMGQGGVTYKYFKRMEKKLYEQSVKIGCMSAKNMAYLKENEPYIDEKKIEYFPNTVKINDLKMPERDGERRGVRFMFGGNMGKPQGIDFLLEGIKEAAQIQELKDVTFDFIGDGSESRMIEDFIRDNKTGNLTYSHAVDRDTYERMLSDADIGIISLSERFTIPNYPSRILSYMQVAKPVLAVTDVNTDMKELVLDEACCGYWVRSGDKDGFIKELKRIVKEKDSLSEKGMQGRRYLEEHFDVRISADILERAYRG